MGAPRGSAALILARRRPSIQDETPGKRSLPGKEGKAPARGACRDDRAHTKPFKNKVYKIRDRDPGKWSLPGRPFQAQDRISEDTPRQGPGTDKLQSPASSLPRQDQDPGKTLAGESCAVCLRSSSPDHASPWGLFQGRVAGGCAAWGARWHSLVAKPSPWQAETQ